MNGLKPGTIFTLMGFIFAVDSTDKNGNSFIKQTGATSVKEYEKLKEVEIRQRKIKDKKKKGVSDE